MDWNQVRFFEKSEFSPDSKFISPDIDWDMDQRLIEKLDHIRSVAGKEYGNIRFVVRRNGGFSLYEGHGTSSLHGNYLFQKPPAVSDQLWFYYNLVGGMIGRAADVTIEEKINGQWVPWSWLRQASFVYQRIDEKFGLGIYPWWHRPGFHLDYRAENEERSPAIWWRDTANEYHALPFDRFPDLLEQIRQHERQFGRSFP